MDDSSSEQSLSIDSETDDRQNFIQQLYLAQAAGQNVSSLSSIAVTLIWVVDGGGGGEIFTPPFVFP